MDFNQVLGPLTQALWQLAVGLWWLWALLGFITIVRILLDVRQRRRLARSGIADIDRMSGSQFERYLEVLFQELGFQVNHTGRSGDYGADLVLSKAGTRTAVQAKCWAKSVGVKAVQEVVGAKAMHDCTRAMVVTNRHYSKAARTLADKNAVELWDREKLVSTILSLQQRSESATAIRNR